LCQHKFDITYKLTYSYSIDVALEPWPLPIAMELALSLRSFPSIISKYQDH